MPAKRIPLEDKFWAGVEKTEGCWPWTKSKFRGGYGRINELDRSLSAHRVSWELHNGPVPDGMCVCHTCDNPSCANPAHLFLGSSADNLADMVKKGRSAKGIGHPNAKLTETHVDYIKRFIGLGLSFAKIAELYHVDKSTITSINTGRTWSHVDV